MRLACSLLHFACLPAHSPPRDLLMPPLRPHRIGAVVLLHLVDNFMLGRLNILLGCTFQQYTKIYEYHVELLVLKRRVEDLSQLLQLHCVL